MDVWSETAIPRSLRGPRVESRRSSDPGLWIGFNVLVCGPSGSGKMSFVRTLSAAAVANARVRVYDFETEREAQRDLIAEVLTSLRAVREQSDGAGDVVHILRHLHRIKGAMLFAFVMEMKELVIGCIEDSAAAPALRLHATSYDNVRWPKGVRQVLHQIFPCWIRLSDDCASQRDLGRFIKLVLTDLNRRYGRDVTEVEAEVIAALRRHARGRSLHELRNLIERAYVASPGPRLRASTLISIV